MLVVDGMIIDLENVERNQAIAKAISKAMTTIHEQVAADGVASHEAAGKDLAAFLLNSGVHIMDSLECAPS